MHLDIYLFYWEFNNFRHNYRGCKQCHKLARIDLDEMNVFRYLCADARMRSATIAVPYYSDERIFNDADYRCTGVT